MRWVLLGEYGLRSSVFWEWLDDCFERERFETLSEMPEEEARRVYESLRRGCGKDRYSFPCELLERVHEEVSFCRLPLGYVLAVWEPFAVFVFARWGLREALLFPIFYLVTRLKLAPMEAAYLDSLARELAKELKCRDGLREDPCTY
ncbi:hypothetical protein [Thermofilum pendens]|uniref:Uncharacterized protein n=1 Tax=Thermofilum pendens (strain DSM 2475 / Hrk 5) TaxID=368408 RepID=A1RYZ0_THEPD|nr:hypothetical protein [Thermofilum pendens]ABL78420.1 hypothetical protein Tpen_1020 [Thermofilum pendens Hrk 5]